MTSMMAADLAKLSLKDFIGLYNSDSLPEEFKHLTISDIVRIAENEEQNQEAGIPSNLGAGQNAALREGQDEPEDNIVVTNTVTRSFTWREKTPYSNNCNTPLLLWRANENSDATLSLAFGLYDQEFMDMKEEVL